MIESVAKERALRSVAVRGVHVWCQGRSAAVQRIDELIAAKHSAIVCCAPVHLVEVARRDPSVRNALFQADLVVPDGKPVAWVASLTVGRLVERVTGSDLFSALVLQRADLKHFLYGSTQEVLGRMSDRVARENGGQVVGVLSPPFAPLSDCDFAAHAAAINAADPDVVWVGLGAPKQELWMQRTRPLINAPVLIGVGAVFEFVAGTKPRAPNLVQRVGLEWAFRLLLEPRRLGRRYAVTNAAFVGGVLAEGVRRVVFRRQTA